MADEDKNATAAGTAGENETPETNNAAEGGQAAQPDDTKNNKLFTQAELDQKISERLKREREKMPSKEELAAYKKWQDDQKTAEERHAGEISAANSRAAAAEARAEKYEQLDAVREAGVEPRFAAFVAYAAAAAAKENGCGFDEALALFLEKEGGAYTKKQEPAPPPEPKTRTVTADTGTKPEGGEGGSPKIPESFIR